MKTVALILLLTAGGCAHKETLSKNQAQATSQIQRWVPIGTPIADAIRTMEKHGFKTMVVDHGGTYLDCEYRSKGSFWNPTVLCGRASFPITDAKTSGVQVQTYLKGL